MAYETLFVYGTLRFPHVQLEIIGRQVRGEADTLPGYCRSAVRAVGRYYPSVQKARGAEVAGLRLRVTQAELAQLDRYEGPAYRRIQVRLQSSQLAWVYVGK